MRKPTRIHDLPPKKSTHSDEVSEGIVTQLTIDSLPLSGLSMTKAG